MSYFSKLRSNHFRWMINKRKGFQRASIRHLCCDEDERFSYHRVYVEVVRSGEWCQRARPVCGSSGSDLVLLHVLFPTCQSQLLHHHSSAETRPEPWRRAGTHNLLPDTQPATANTQRPLICRHSYTSPESYLKHDNGKQEHNHFTHYTFLKKKKKKHACKFEWMWMQILEKSR